MSGILRRRMMMHGAALPYDAEVQYLGFTGTQYINTGIIQRTRNFELRMRLRWTGSTTEQFESFFAYMRQSGGTEPRSGLHKYQGKWMFGTNASQSSGINVDGSVHDFMITGNASSFREAMYIDSVSVATAITTGTGIAANNLAFYIGCRNRGSSPIDNWASVDVMSANYKLFGDAAHTTLAGEYDYIPVRIGSVGYLYEKISGQMFGNDGTDAFIVGSDV